MGHLATPVSEEDLLPETMMDSPTRTPMDRVRGAPEEGTKPEPEEGGWESVAIKASKQTAQSTTEHK